MIIFKFFKSGNSWKRYHKTENGMFGTEISRPTFITSCRGGAKAMVGSIGGHVAIISLDVEVGILGCCKYFMRMLQK